MAKPKTTKDAPSAPLAEGDRPTLDPEKDLEGLADALSADSDTPPPPSTEPEVKEQAKANPLLPPPPAPEPAPAPLRTRADVRAGRLLYKVWAHGKLKRGGKVYEPGATLALTAAEAAELGCVEPA